MIGIFYGIRDFQYAGPSSFLWMQSIADPDPYYILPILSALATFIQSKQTMPASDNPQGKVMLYFMPLFIVHQLQVPGGPGAVLGSHEHYADWTAVPAGRKK